MQFSLAIVIHIVYCIFVASTSESLSSTASKSTNNADSTLEADEIDPQLSNKLVSIVNDQVSYNLLDNEFVMWLGFRLVMELLIFCPNSYKTVMSENFQILYSFLL